MNSNKSILTIKNYKIGLSLIGIIAVALIMLPNIVYLFRVPPNDVLSGNEASYWLWNVLENIGRFGVMISLCVVINKAAPQPSRAATIAAACLLLIYYALWAAYFVGAFSGLSLVGMAFFPSLFFLLIAWRQRNLIAFTFALLFAIVHIAVTGSNFLL